MYKRVQGHIHVIYFPWTLRRKNDCKSFLDSLAENNDYNVKTRKAENYLVQPAS